MLGNRGGFERQMSARIQNNVEQPEEDGEIGQSENSEVKGGSNLSQNPVVSGVTMGASGCGMDNFLITCSHELVRLLLSLSVCKLSVFNGSA